MIPPLWQRQRGTKEPLDESVRGEWKCYLKIQHSKTKVKASEPNTSWQIDGDTMETVTDYISLCSKFSMDGDCRHEIKRHLLLGRKATDKPRQCIKKQRHYFANNVCIVKAMIFLVVMWNLDNKEGRVMKNWYLQAVVLKKTLECPLDSKKIKSVNSKGNHPWIIIGRTDAKAEAPILWLSYVKSQLIGKDPDAGKDWRQEEKGMADDEMVGWHHWLNRHEFE